MGKRLSKQALLAEIGIEKQKLDRSLCELTSDQMIDPGVTPGGWSVKDILAHLMGWQRMILSFHEAEQRGETPEVPGHGLTWRDTPKLNDLIYREHKDRPLETILNDFEAGHQSMLDLVESVPENLFVSVGRFKWMGPSWCLSDYVRAETASHYRWASNHIKRWRRRNDVT